MEIQILTLADIEKYTNYSQIIQNKDYLNLLIYATNYFVLNNLQEKNGKYQINQFHTYFSLMIFEYLLNINTTEKNILELMHRWL